MSTEHGKRRRNWDKCTTTTAAATSSQQIVIVVPAVNNIVSYICAPFRVQIEQSRRIRKMREKKLNVKMCSRCLWDFIIFEIRWSIYFKALIERKLGCKFDEAHDIHNRGGAWTREMYATQLPEHRTSGIYHIHRRNMHAYVIRELEVVCAAAGAYVFG